MNRIVLGMMGAAACVGAIIFGSGLIRAGETDALIREIRRLSRRIDVLERHEAYSAATPKEEAGE
ncbi:MAG: hypothetical protein ABIG71_03700 [Candidatus Uhrbacteria bacterium]